MLKEFAHPLTLTALQFGVGSLLAGAMWLLGLHKKPEGNFLENVRLLLLCCRGLLRAAEHLAGQLQAGKLRRT